MASFLFAFIAVVLVSIGSRDQLLVARLVESLGRSAGLLVAGLLAACVSAGAMGWAGAAIGQMLDEQARAMLVAIALLLAAAELAWPNRERAPAEPTRSLAAIFLVLLARQLGDGARFLLFALAALAASPLLAVAGGALAGMAATAAAWGAGALLPARVPLRAIRVVLSLALLAAAIVVGLGARGIVG
jgi:putative Ca2+/H+ antiporter (TMEM165/GDT1 family)